MKEVVLTLIVLWSCLPSSEQCMSPDVEMLSKKEIFSRAKLVIYGKDRKHTNVKGSDGQNRTDASFEVYCVLKSSGEVVPEKLQIRRIMPRTSCETPPTVVGKEYIAILKKVGPSTYEWDPVAEMQYAAFQATLPNLDAARLTCGYQDLHLPNGRSKEALPTCPRPLEPETTCPPPMMVEEPTTEMPTYKMPTAEDPTTQVPPDPETQSSTLGAQAVTTATYLICISVRFTVLELCLTW